MDSDAKGLGRKIYKALKRTNTHRPEDISAAIDRGDMQQFSENGTVVVTIVHTFPQVRKLEIFMVAGELRTAWRIHDEQIVAFAKEKRCKSIFGSGRDGWVRDAKSHGYAPVETVMEMEIGDAL